MAELQYHTIGGYAGVRIYPERRLYEVIEPFLTRDEKEEAVRIKAAMPEIAGPCNTPEAMGALSNALDGMLRREAPDKRKTYKYYALRDLAGAGMLEPLLRDDKIEAIRCAGAGIPIEVNHRDFGALKTNITFRTKEEVDAHAAKISGTGAFRAETHAAGGFSLERQKKGTPGIGELADARTITPEMIAHAWLALERKESILVTGGDEGSRDALLNAICTLIPPFRTIISIEQKRSLNIPHKDWSARVTHGGYGPKCGDGKRFREVTFEDLLSGSLEKEPDHTILRECSASQLIRCGGRFVASAGRLSLAETGKIPRCMMFKLAKTANGTRTAEILLVDSKTTKICEWEPETDSYAFHEDIHAHTRSARQDLEYKMRALRWIGERGYHPPFFGLFTEER